MALLVVAGTVGLMTLAATTVPSVPRSLIGTIVAWLPLVGLGLFALIYLILSVTSRRPFSARSYIHVPNRCKHMGGSSFGTLFRLLTFGELHGTGVGVIVDGCPAGLALDEGDIQRDLDRRRVGQSRMSSARNEVDLVRVLSGVFEGRTTGTPIAMVVENTNARPQDYDTILGGLYRPGHADFTWDSKFGFRDYRGGGRSSARETIGRVAAGAVARKLLATSGIQVLAWTQQLAHLRAQTFDESEIERNPMRCPDPEVALQMVEMVEQANELFRFARRHRRDTGAQRAGGLGRARVRQARGRIGKAMLSIPAVKGVETARASATRSSPAPSTTTRSCSAPMACRYAEQSLGGVQGGISNGEPIACASRQTAGDDLRAQSTVNPDGKAT